MTPEQIAQDVELKYRRACAESPVVFLAPFVEAAIAAERKRWAAFADENGEPRKVLGTLPITADGCIVGNHTKLWINNVGYVSSLRVDNIGCSDRDGGDEAFWEAGECYSTREAAESARNAGKGEKDGA